MDEDNSNTYFDLGSVYGGSDGEAYFPSDIGEIFDSEPSPASSGGFDSGSFSDPAFWDFVNAYLQQSGLDSGVDLMSLSPSSSSYLSTTQLDLFDRILAGGSYRYYIGYRTGSDSYGAVLYACNDVSVSGSTVQLVNPMQFQLYRTYSGSTYYYYYTHSQLASDSVTLNNNILYYTNIFPGYPLLAEQGDSDVSFSKDQIIFAGVMLLIFFLIVLRRRHK